jgi:hypothetical protein
MVGVYTKDAEVATFKEEMKATFQMSDLGSLLPGNRGAPG